MNRGWIPVTNRVLAEDFLDSFPTTYLVTFISVVNEDCALLVYLSELRKS